MSKDVRRLFAAQKAAKAGAAASPSSLSTSPSTSSSKRVTHPLAKYDPKTFRLTCAICGPAVPIKSDSLWNAHLVSKAHQDAVAKLRAVKEQMQRKEAEAAEQRRLQQEQQQAQQAQAQAQQGVKRKAVGGLVAYADDSESDSDGEEEGAVGSAATTNSQAAVTSDFKRVKIDDEASEQAHHRAQQEQEEIEDEEEAMAGLPAGFFDATAPAESTAQEEKQGTEPETMEGVLPSGFFDDPEEDARIRAEVGGATADLQQRQVDAEFKALEAELARDLERQEKQEAQIRSGQAVDATSKSTMAATTNGQVSSSSNSEHIPYEEKVELEEQELEESIMARSEEEYLLFVEMQERLDALREKKERLLVHQKSAGSSSSASTASASTSGSAASKKTKAGKTKSKSILDLVREQELAKKEKERRAAEEFAKANADRADSRMGGDEDDDEDESDEDDEDIEAMMDWRARRV
ncbi:hypothetical protein BGX29_009319 [Mortierella sp. GBA35]|nr:hypothetical protein BGX29_009319 [Mortierella sp. GBA35]